MSDVLTSANVRFATLGYKIQDKIGYKVRDKIRAVTGKLTEKDGGMDEGVKTVLIVVIGMAVLFGLIALLDNTVLPGISNKVTEMFGIK
jgi:hypothetical protein